MQHVWQIIVLNGFEGGFSAIAYVGAHFIYGSWYKKSELGVRAAVFVSFGHVCDHFCPLTHLGDVSGVSPPETWKLSLENEI